MNIGIGIALVAALVAILWDVFRRSMRHSRRVTREKAAITTESGATASIGVFHAAGDTSILIGASEDCGAFYYRMVHKGNVVNRTRINLANLVKTDLILDNGIKDLGTYARQKTSALTASDVASRETAKSSSESLRGLRRVAIRINFLDDSGQTKMLEVTVLRADNDQHRYQRIELYKDAVWWAVFLTCAGVKAREDRDRLLERRAEKEKKIL